MPKTDIGPKIGIEGEAEFKRQIKETMTSVKTLGTAVELVTSQFINNEQSVEALTAKNEALGAKEVEVARASQLLFDQMQKVAAAYGEADPKTQKLTQEYNKNETQLNKLRAEIEANENKIRSLTQAESENDNQTATLTNSMAKLSEGAGGADGLLKALGVNVQGLTKHLGLSKEQTGLLSEALGGGGMSLAASVTGVAAAIALAAEAVKKLVDFMAEAVSEATDYADNINTLSTNYHIAAETLQEYQYMAELTDTSLDTITGSITKLTRSMDSARSGNEETAAAFAKLNIRVTDANGELRDSSDVFEQAVGALNMVHNETERDTIAMTLFGRSAMELNSLIAAMADGSFKELQREAHAMGYVLSDEDITALADLDDQFVRFDNQMTAIKNQIAAEMAPALIELAQQLLEVAQTVDWREFGAAAADAIRDLTPMIIDMANAVAGAAEALANLIGEIHEFRSSGWGGYGQFGSWETPATSISELRRRASLGGSRVENVTLQLDGYTVGRAMTGSVNSRNYTRGSGL